MPPLEALARNLTVPISVDTYKSSVAREALRAGASIVTTCGDSSETRLWRR